jgi:hypothetical protein
MVVLTIAACGRPSNAAGDPIPITVTAGFMTMERVNGGYHATFVLDGTGGFSLRGTGDGLRRDACSTCFPGESFSHSATLFAGFGTFTFAGQYHDLNIEGSGGPIEADSPLQFTLPEVADLPLRLRAPFSLAGTVTIADWMFRDGSRGPQIFQLSGGGWARSVFVPQGDAHSLQQLQYGVVPEPATVLLVGGGLAGLLARRHRGGVGGAGVRR